VDLEDVERVKRYIGFDDETSAALRALHALTRPHLEEVAAEFCRWLNEDESSRRFLGGGAEQIGRLGQALAGWLDASLLGPHDAAHLEAHARIGQVHARIGLPESLMIAAMSRIRSRLVALAEDTVQPLSRAVTLRAIHKLLDLELALMLEAFRRSLETRVRTQERLATIGHLAASIGHELRSPLGVIESSTFLIRQRLTPTQHTEAVIRHLDKIGAQVRVCSSTTAELLELARNRPPSCREVIVRELVEAAIGAVDVPAYRVERDIPQELTMRADPDQMRQVFVNLVSNAHQAIGEQGHIWITAEPTDSGTLVRIRDDGPGVPAAIRDQVFDPLFTTKPRGTGLGLALCRRIVEAHRGEISLEPSEGGACFRVFVPGGESASPGGGQRQQGDDIGAST
jgi:two-component system sensor histidine kinase HydH